MGAGPKGRPGGQRLPELPDQRAAAAVEHFHSEIRKEHVSPV
jgi:hypothetical protein